MRITELANNPDVEKLAALSQFLIGRAQDTDARKEIALRSYLNLARAQGISLTADQLRNLIQEPPLSNLIVNVEGDDQTGKVIFKGGDAVTDTMTVDQARQTVDTMAKRAIDI